MKKETFLELWHYFALDWYNNGSIAIDFEKQKTEHCFKELCELNPNCALDIYKKYEHIKEFAKKAYFYDNNSSVKVNRYKRAAMIVYAINLSEPLILKNITRFNVDNLFLKQRLAFHVALYSIVMEYPEDIISKSDNIFDFNIKSKGVGDLGSDSFLDIIYKDIFFSAVYKNYNIITMSNVFLLLVEKSSILSGLSECCCKKDLLQQ